MSDKNNRNKIRRRTISSTASNQTENKTNSFRKTIEGYSDKNLRNQENSREFYRDRDENTYSYKYNEDIKMYNPRRSTRESRVKIIREASYKNDDKDLKMYSPKRSQRKSSLSNEATESSAKKGKIRIKKQASSGSGGRYSLKDNNKNKYDDRNKVIRFRTPNMEENDDEYYEEVPRKKKGKIATRLLKKIITTILILFIVAGSAGLLYVRSVISDMPVLTKKMVYESYINKDPVPLSEIPKTLQNAVIAVEDQRFYKHGGVDIKSVIRSFVNNLSGDMIQGGSTIDMQLSKNLLTNNERTIKRKIQDMYNAMMLNKIMTKDEILEAYLNNIYMGKSAYGVQAGAKLYFGKDVSKLNFGQCTMLAGITNNPKLYQDYEQAKKRQAVVLYKMYKLGYIKEYVYKAQLYRDTPFKSEIDK